MERKAYTEAYKDQVEQYLNLVRVVKDNTSLRKLAEYTDQSVQNLSQKIKRGSLNATELWQIAEVFDCDVKFVDKKTGKVIIRPSPFSCAGKAPLHFYIRCSLPA